MIKLIRLFIAMIWLSPIILLWFVFNSRKSEKLGFIYRDCVRLLTEI